jgi:hypothetical protein
MLGSSLAPWPAQRQWFFSGTVGWALPTLHEFRYQVSLLPRAVNLTYDLLMFLIITVMFGGMGSAFLAFLVMAMDMGGKSMSMSGKYKFVEDELMEVEIENPLAALVPNSPKTMSQKIKVKVTKDELTTGSSWPRPFRWTLGGRGFLFRGLISADNIQAVSLNSRRAWPMCFIIRCTLLILLTDAGTT